MADTANNKQFSVMVDKDGALSYPQNFITANSLAKFGSDINGTLNSLTITEIGSSSKTFDRPECIAFIPTEYNSDTNEFTQGKITFFVGDDAGARSFSYLNISTQETLISGSSVIRLHTGNDNAYILETPQITLKSNELSLEHIKNNNSARFVLKNDGIDFGVSYDGVDITVNNNILINQDKIAVSAPLVELPANTTIGGKSAVTSAPDNMVTTDTDQYIFGKKYFYGSAEFGEFAGGNDEFLFRNKIVAIGGIHIPVSSDNDSPIFAASKDEVLFSVPQHLRVFDTVNNGWTYTYKYVYLAQDANGNVTLAISDTKPNPNEVL